MDTRATGQRQALRSYNMCADTEVRSTSTFVLAYVCRTTSQRMFSDATRRGKLCRLAGGWEEWVVSD